MKSKIKALAAGLVMGAATLFSASPAHAQYGGGANLGVNNYFQVGYAPLGIGLSGHYNSSESFRTSVSLNYMLPSTDEDGESTNALNLNINAHYIFVGDLEEEGFRLYGIAGIGANYFTFGDEPYLYYGGNLGLGFEFSPEEDGMSFFAEPVLTIGAGNSMTGPSSPTYIGLFAGIRYTIGE